MFVCCHILRFVSRSADLRTRFTLTAAFYILRTHTSFFVHVHAHQFTAHFAVGTLHWLWTVALTAHIYAVYIWARCTLRGTRKNWTSAVLSAWLTLRGWYADLDVLSPHHTVSHFRLARRSSWTPTRTPFVPAPALLALPTATTTLFLAPGFAHGHLVSFALYFCDHYHGHLSGLDMGSRHHSRMDFLYFSTLGISPFSRGPSLPHACITVCAACTFLLFYTAHAIASHFLVWFTFIFSWFSFSLFGTFSGSVGLPLSRTHVLPRGRSGCILPGLKFVGHATFSFLVLPLVSHVRCRFCAIFLDTDTFSYWTKFRLSRLPASCCFHLLYAHFHCVFHVHHSFTHGTFTWFAWTPYVPSYRSTPSYKFCTWTLPALFLLFTLQTHSFLGLGHTVPLDAFDTLHGPHCIQFTYTRSSYYIFTALGLSSHLLHHGYSCCSLTLCSLRSRT